jgi:hypothetical protein
VVRADAAPPLRASIFSTAPLEIISEALQRATRSDGQTEAKAGFPLIDKLASLVLEVQLNSPPLYFVF